MGCIRQMHQVFTQDWSLPLLLKKMLFCHRSLNLIESTNSNFSTSMFTNKCRGIGLKPCLHDFRITEHYFIIILWNCVLKTTLRQYTRIVIYTCLKLIWHKCHNSVNSFEVTLKLSKILRALPNRFITPSNPNLFSKRYIFRTVLWTNKNKK